MKYIYALFEFKHTEYFTSSRRFFSSSVGFSLAGIDRAKFGFNIFQGFLFIVVIVTSILLDSAFWQTSIHSYSLVKILWRSDKDKIISKAIEKRHRYGLRKTVSKHLKSFPVFCKHGLRLVFFGQTKKKHFKSLFPTLILSVLVAPPPRIMIGGIEVGCKTITSIEKFIDSRLWRVE